jgi:hypothetical protein
MRKKMTTWIATTKEITLCQCLLLQKKHNVPTSTMATSMRQNEHNY